jgi:predicted transcriptional regulator
MPIKLTPQEYQQKHAARLKGSISDIQAGVNKVTVAPTQQAAAAQAKMLQNLTQAVSSGKWAARLKSVDLQTWQAATINKGLNRIASGIDGAQQKVIDFASQLLPFEASLQDQVSKMPNLTLEDSVQRATNWIRGMSKFTRK